jgi:hypothetical protein
MDNDDQLSAFNFVSSPVGISLLATVKYDDVIGNQLLPTIERLRVECGSAATSLIVDLVAGYESAVRKFGPCPPRWYSRVGLQQASGATTALHRAKRLAAFGKVLEFCTGMGGDALALGHCGVSVSSIESDPVLAAMARLNVSEAGLAQLVRIHTGRAEDWVIDGFDAIYADPSRRTGLYRSTSLRSISPSIEYLSDVTARVPAAAIKLAPASSISDVQSSFPSAEIEFVSVEGELKETVVWISAAAHYSRRATALPSGAELTGEVEAYLPVHEVRAYVADPDPALIRSGLFREFASSTGIDHSLLADRIALLTSDTAVATPFARYFRVIDCLPFSDRNIRKRLHDLNAGLLSVRSRGFPEASEAIRCRLQGELHGDLPYRLFVYRIGERHHAVITDFEQSAGI